MTAYALGYEVKTLGSVVEMEPEVYEAITEKTTAPKARFVTEGSL
ncbi:MAG: hypothetical protein R6X31_10695 [Anaerolineae bacterium]